MAETQHFTSSGQIHPHGSGQTPGELTGAGWITLAAVMLFIAAPASSFSTAAGSARCSAS